MTLLKQEFWRRLDMPPTPFSMWLVLGEVSGEWYYHAIDRRLPYASIANVANMLLEDAVIRGNDLSKMVVYLVDRYCNSVTTLKDVGEGTIDLNGPEVDHIGVWPFARREWTKAQLGEAAPRKKPVAPPPPPVSGLSLVKK